MNELLEASSVNAEERQVKRRIGLREFTGIKWPSSGSAGKPPQSPFDNASEVALVALHTGSDDIIEVDTDNTEMYNIKVRTFVDGVCRLVYGDIEPKEEARAEAARSTGDKSHTDLIINSAVS